MRAHHPSIVLIGQEPIHFHSAAAALTFLHWLLATYRQDGCRVTVLPHNEALVERSPQDRPILIALRH